MRFLVDAQLLPALARWFVAKGHEAEHVGDKGMQAASDTVIWDYALASAAAIVTKDEDFHRAQHSCRTIQRAELTVKDIVAPVKGVPPPGGEGMTAPPLAEPGGAVSPKPTGGKMRADHALVERGLVESRAKAQALILAGKVFSGDRRVEKAGQPVPESAPLAVKGLDHPWVSRGGLKLDHGLTHWGLSAAGRVCVDVGASTGGFTDVLLARGAIRVHAVDVGHGQLAWKLRSDPRVVVHERTNARHLVLAEPVDALVCDASFIGLRTILPAPLAACAPGAWAVALVKPQFEAGPESVGKNGVVRDPAVHAAVCAQIAGWWADLPGWTVLGVEPSPITGPEGNREFLIAARRG